MGSKNFYLSVQDKLMLYSDKKPWTDWRSNHRCFLRHEPLDDDKTDISTNLMNLRPKQIYENSAYQCVPIPKFQTLVKVNNWLTK